MQVRRVEFFLAVVDYGNIRRAAAARGLAQSSMSQAIDVLEGELGARLINRTGHDGISLTAAGIAFLGPARRLVRTAWSMDRQSQSPGLDVVTWGNLAIEPTARVVAQLRREFPQLRVRIEYADDEEAASELVRQGHCEIGTVFLPTVLDDLEICPLGEVELWLILPPGTEPGPDPLPINALSQYPLIEVAGGTQNLFLDRIMLKAGVRARKSVISSHRQALINLVLAGAGASVAAEVYARQAAARGAVVRRFDPPIRRRHAIVHRPDPLSTAAARFIELADRGQHGLQLSETPQARAEGLVFDRPRTPHG